MSEEKIFETNAYLLIKKMVHMDSETEENTSELVDELLHSIFFLGRFTYSLFLPERIFVDDSKNSDVKFLNYLKKTYPKAFELYMAHVPRRSPFSCVLDMIVNLIGQDNEDQIKDKLEELSNKLQQNNRSKILNSTMVCVSYVSYSDSKKSVKYYGVSMSTHQTISRQIIIAASCLNFWDDFVADAVMTYYPKKKNQNFDGTIRLPADVRCETFNISRRKQMLPCLSCSDLFALQTTETKKKSPYGNCAEVESLSKLLKSEKIVKKQVQESDKWNEQDRQKVKSYVSHHLKDLLNNNKHFKWNNREIKFYTPQYASPMVLNNDRLNTRPTRSDIINGINVRNDLDAFIKYNQNDRVSQPSKKIEYRSVTTENLLNGFKNKLMAQNWDIPYNSNDIYMAYEELLRIFWKFYINFPMMSFNKTSKYIDHVWITARIFNKFFVNIGLELAKQTPDTLIPTEQMDPLIDRDLNSMFLTAVSEKERKETDFKCTKKSVDFDDIDMLVLKKVIEGIYKTMTYIYDLLFQFGTFSNKMKISDVAPLFKTENKHLFTNYRLISLLPKFSRNLAELFYNQWDQFPDEHKPITESQYGFSANLPTALAQLDSTKEATNSIDQKQHTGGIFLDLKTAFNSINPNILNNKLERSGIRGNELNWVKSYLCDRKQFVMMGDHSPSCLDITCFYPTINLLLERNKIGRNQSISKLEGDAKYLYQMRHDNIEHLQRWKKKFGFDGKLRAESHTKIVKDIKLKCKVDKDKLKNLVWEAANDWLIAAVGQQKVDTQKEAKSAKSKTTLALEDQEDENQVGQTKRCPDLNPALCPTAAPLKNTFCCLVSQIQINKIIWMDSNEFWMCTVDCRDPLCDVTGLSFVMLSQCLVSLLERDLMSRLKINEVPMADGLQECKMKVQNVIEGQGPPHYHYSLLDT